MKTSTNVFLGILLHFSGLFPMFTDKAKCSSTSHGAMCSFGIIVHTAV